MNAKKNTVGNSTTPAAGLKGIILRIIVVLVGILFGQVILYGPSLAGIKILLPLDILEQPKTYIPNPNNLPVAAPHNKILSDLVFLAEPARRFATTEFRAGRFPVWNPHQYAGAPFLIPKLSPFALILANVQSPRIIPWVQVLSAFVAGLGAYLFFRSALPVSFWPAAIASWCYPLTGFFVLWQGCGLSFTVVWLPWLFIAINRTIRAPNLVASAGLAIVTALVVGSGRLDMAGQALLASGLYAVWCFFNEYSKAPTSGRALGSGAAVILGWGLGFLLSAPDVLPEIEYAQTGARYMRRSMGAEERPPVGLAALPQLVLPKMYGSTVNGSCPIFPARVGNLLESPAQTYTGLLASLFLAPLAWSSRRHRSIRWFFFALGFFALSWTLNVPGLVSILRLPVLNMMSHNRFVFVTAFGIMAMAAVGLDVLWSKPVEWRVWFWLPVTLLGGLFCWSVYRMIIPAEPIATELTKAVIAKFGVASTDLEEVSHIQRWFSHQYAVSALLCSLAIVGWLSLRRSKQWPPLAVLVLGALLVADLLWFGYGESSQCDPRLYYPDIPLLQKLAKSPPGRIVGANCLPPALAQTQGLSDIRGYDTIDPARLMDLMSMVAQPVSPIYSYSQTQFFIPQLHLSSPDPSQRSHVAGLPRALELPPILNMLGVKYVVFRGTPPAFMHADFLTPDYWAVINQGALPRAYVPEQVETVLESRNRLERMNSPAFDPRKLAFVESPVMLPDVCEGAAEIIDEIPTRITLSIQMRTAGLVVLSDLWDVGWHAYLNGETVPILRTNHALRGVVVPEGKSRLEFRYEPASLKWGLRISSMGLITLLGCFAPALLHSIRRAG